MVDNDVESEGLNETHEMAGSEDQEYYSSDEDYEVNRIGSGVPLEWYNDLDHVGYSISGEKVKKSEFFKDKVDQLLASKDDPLYKRTIFDERNNERIVLTNKELLLVRRMVECKFVNETPDFEAESDFYPYYSSQTLDIPLGFEHEPKRRFLPSKWEKMKVIKFIKAIREGRIKLEDEDGAKGDDGANKQKNFYLLWDDSDESKNKSLGEKRLRMHIPAPKQELPGHALSYHPPSEYLLDEEETRRWIAAREMEEDGIPSVLPADFKKLRLVPAYQDFVRERFERCLDLYLCARKKRDKLNIDPESLVPKLPSPKELRPFPNVLALSYFGHEGQVRHLSISQNGELLASGDTKKVVKIWEVETTRVLVNIDLSSVAEGEISKITFNPKFPFLGVAVGKHVLVFDISVFSACNDNLLASNCKKMLSINNQDITAKDEAPQLVMWEKSEYEDVDFQKLTFNDQNYDTVVDFCWHHKGLYLVTVTNSTARKKVGQILIHHISNHRSQKIFGSKSQVAASNISKVAFHPSKPILFLASQQSVYCFELVQKKLIKRLKSGSKWISSLAVHKSGDHVIVGGYDKRVCWFDLDMKDAAYKNMKYHEKAVRGVAFHPNYPLMASGADDGTVHVFHAKVFPDLLKNPLIVPVKAINAHDATSGFGVFAVEFHPKQPWVFSSGADGNIHLFQNSP